MADRKIIFKCVVGSKLYGTDTPDSDTDYSGVFLPSSEDLLGLQNCPTEWTFNEKISTGDRNTKGDVDCKFFSLQRFIQLAAQGQPGQLELLFAPQDKTIICEPEWEEIKKNSHLFLSKKGIGPFLGFAAAQSYKASIKGENLNHLRAINEWGNTLTPMGWRSPLMSLLKPVFLADGSGAGKLNIKETPIELDTHINEFGFQLVEVAGRKFDINIKTKDFLLAVVALIARYGTRSNAAAVDGYDYKSLMHAFRLIDEAKEFLEIGHITLPRPDAASLLMIRTGEAERKYGPFDWHEELQKRIVQVKEIEAKSRLPDRADNAKLEKLCQRLLKAHILLG